MAGTDGEQPATPQADSSDVLRRLEGEPPVDHHIAECDTCGRVERAGWSLDELNRLEDIFASHIDDGSACYGYSIERIYENGQGRTVA